MKTKKIMMLIIGLIISTSAFSQTKKVEEITIKTSAVCDMCKFNLEKTLSYEKGVKKSELNWETKMLKVWYNPKKTNPDKIRKAISKAGYDADDVPADPQAYKDLNACCKKDYVH